MGMVADTLERLSKMFPWLREDLESEAALAVIEADRDSLDDEWVCKRLELFASDERKEWAGKVVFNEHGAGDGRGLQRLRTVMPGGRTRRPSEMSPPILVPSTLTPGQKRRFHRDLMIQYAFQAGFPQAIIIEVFGIQKTRLFEICYEDLLERYKAKTQS